MLILEPDGQLDHLPRRRTNWRARFMAWLFGADQPATDEMVALDLPATIALGIHEDEHTA
jgi:hypothetical protein